MSKQIKRNKANRDYDMFLNNEYVGSRETYREAEIELDRLAFELLSH